MNKPADENRNRRPAPSNPRSHTFATSYAELIAWMRQRIFAENNVDYLLKFAEFYGAIRSGNFDGVYQDEELEQNVAAKIFRSQRFHPPAITHAAADTVIIASELYDAGGHSRVVLNWLKAFKEERNHRLLITRSATSNIQQFLDANGFRYHMASAQGVASVNEIVTYCADATRIVLVIHPDDIVAAVAARFLAASGIEILLYTDFLFTFAISFADPVCETGSYGMALNRRTQRARRSCYLGIPIDATRNPTSTACIQSANDRKTILSCGIPYKYAPSEVFFGDFIDRLLLQRPDTRVLLAGPTGREQWWAHCAPRWGDRVRFLGELPHDRYVAVMASADVYVDSFPITGGTAFPEALLNGKMIAGLAAPIQGYSPADELRVGTVEQLASRVIDLLDNQAEAVKHVEQVKIKAAEVHGLDAFRDRVRSIYAGHCGGIPWENCPNVDLQWIERQWMENATLLHSDSPQLLNLSFADFFSFLSKTRKLQGMLRYRVGSYRISRLFLKVLPSRPRNCVVRLRAASMRKVSAPNRRYPHRP